ncbi:MAG: DEAD/DEAH box helicase [Bdellovibrionota bacterium]
MNQTMTFSDLGLNPELVKHLLTMQFTTPTPIQVNTIPKLLKSKDDFVGLAPTGTGKTAAFGLPLIEKIDANKNAIQALVLSPTRELAQQVSLQLQNFGRQKNIKVVTVYGGASYSTQLSGLKRGAHIVVATPGRLVDFIEKKALSLANVQVVVLDEADEMVSRGFKDDLEFILEATKGQETHPQTWLFSATMSSQVSKIANSYLKVTETTEIKKEDQINSNVKQMYIAVPERDKAEVLTRILQADDNFYGLIFCEMKSQVSTLTRILTERGFAAEAIHGDRTQQERETTLARFRKRAVRILVATDVAARGLDIKELTHVINYTMPWVVDTYTHRIGRTGRNGESGTVINIISNQEVRDMHRIQGQLKVQMEKLEIPSGQKLALQKIASIQENLVKATENEFLFNKALKMVEDSVSAIKEKTPNEILAAMLIADYSDLLFQKDIQPLTLGAGNRGSGTGGGVSRSRRGGGGGGRYGRRDDRGEGGSRGYGRRDDRGGGYKADVRDDRGERSERRGPRADRADRPERSERPARAATADRGERAERSERKPRKEGDRSSFSGARKPRSASSERSRPRR